MTKKNDLCKADRLRLIEIIEQLDQKKQDLIELAVEEVNKVPMSVLDYFSCDNWDFFFSTLERSSKRCYPVPTANLNERRTKREIQ